MKDANAMKAMRAMNKSLQKTAKSMKKTCGLAGPFGNRKGKAIDAVERCGCASTGKLLKDGAKRYRGTPMRKEAPGPAYSGVNSGSYTVRLSRKRKCDRIPYRVLAGLTPCDRIRVGVKLGYLQKREGTKCPFKCGKTLKLLETPRQTGVTMDVDGLKLMVHTLGRYYCPTDGCNDNSNGAPVEDDGKRTGLPLGGRGRAPAGEGLLCICLAAQPWAAAHTSLGDIGLVQGIPHPSVQLYLDESRRKMAQLSKAEQQSIKFKRGQLVEWDECGLRAEHVKCDESPCAECGPTCLGCRLLYNRLIIGVVRGDRRYLVVGQLPWKTCHAEGGGVPTSGAECDAFCLKYMGEGVINLTDGADAYEAFAAGEVACSPTCARKDCLRRAAERGEEGCNGWRPRTGRARFQSKYKDLLLSHGIVSHSAEEWSLVKQVRVYDARGRSQLISIKHGTEVADGAWAEVKRSYPRQVNSRDHERIFEYVSAWAWKARRHGEDIFREFAAASR